MEEDLLKTLTAELTLGCRILADQEIVDAFGQFSARIPGSDGLYLINRGISPALAREEDFIICNSDGAIVRGDGPINSEWPIHACVYKARPDVQAILHSHSRLSRIFSLSSLRLRGMLTSSSPEWHEGVPVYRAAGLITSKARGDRLAEVLGNRTAALLRGHGDVVATGGIKQTVMKAITLKQNADVLNEVLHHGADIDLWSEDELATWSDRRIAGMADADREALAGRAWDYYVARVDGRFARLMTRS